ncbi:MAG TPA: NAD(P)/FAD-dependent oxidoreductase [Verrucomicrobiae bacterium]|jgi:lysine 2-monooxygenase|nr:NAD(P)/FAD-dependent oxidoreductase [Verrucomicrobiae bacterium]
MNAAKKPAEKPPITMFGPDFPFAYDNWVKHPAGLGKVPAERHGTEVAVIGAGIAGLLSAFELMKMGLKPVVYEAGRLGGRLRSVPFEGAEGVIAELGAMRFPVSSTTFYHYLAMAGLETKPFPNPMSPATPSTVIDLEGEPIYVEKPEDLPRIFKEVEAAWNEALEHGAQFAAMQDAMRRRDVAKVKAIWNSLIPIWDERSFYGFVATSDAFARRSYRHREIFGQVGFGTGGWDTDFPNSMLEILRVVYTDQDSHQRLVVGGVEQLPRRLWKMAPDHAVHWPSGTSLDALHGGGPRPGVARIARDDDDGKFLITDRWGDTRRFDAVVCTCQTWLMSTTIETEERLFPQKLWMAMDRTHYMQSSKTFVMVDRPFWNSRDAKTGRYVMSQTLSDRLTRGTYLFDNGPDKPAVICLSYTWMGDALKVLPFGKEKRVKLMLDALQKVYPKLDIAKHIIGDPITVSWEADPDSLGAFKGNLPGHYRYQRRMFCHFKEQKDLAPAQRGLFLAGDDISWTAAWVEGAVQSALNAVWGVVDFLGGAAPKENPGPGDLYDEIQPLALPD